MQIKQLLHSSVSTIGHSMLNPTLFNPKLPSTLNLSLSLGVQGCRESLPVAHQVVRRRFSGPLLLPPLSRRHSGDTRRASAAPALPIDSLEVLYCRALTSRDEHRSVAHKLVFFLSSFVIFFLYLSEVSG